MLNILAVLNSGTGRSINTIGSRYNAAQYNMQLQTVLVKIEPEDKSDFALKKDNSYFALSGEQWGVFFDDLGHDLSPYSGSALCYAIPNALLT